MNRRFSFPRRLPGTFQPAQPAAMPRSSCFRRAALFAIAIGLPPTASMARIYLADHTLDQIIIFPNNASGNTAPTVTIGGSNTGLSAPFGVATDANHIYV